MKTALLSFALSLGCYGQTFDIPEGFQEAQCGHLDGLVSPETARRMSGDFQRYADRLDENLTTRYSSLDEQARSYLKADAKTARQCSSHFLAVAEGQEVTIDQAAGMRLQFAMGLTGPYPATHKKRHWYSFRRR